MKPWFGLNHKTPRKALACVVGFYLATNLAGLAQCIQNFRRTDTGDYYPFANDAVYDAAHHRLLSFDGVPEIYAYDGNQWALLTKGGPAADILNPKILGTCYDSVRGEVLVFWAGDNLVGSNYFGHTYLYELRGNTWTFLPHYRGTPAPVIGTLQEHTPCAFDPNRGRAIFLLRNTDTDTLYQTWEWDGTSWDQGPTVGPLLGIPTYGRPAAFLFDTSQNRGFLVDQDCETVFLYTPGTTAAEGRWDQANLRPAVVRYAGVTFAYDPFRGRVIQCFGNDATADFSRLKFQDNFREWDPVAQLWVDAPDRHFNVAWDRANALAAYDTDRDRLVVFGGFASVSSEFTDTLEQANSGAGIVTSSSGTSVHCVGETAVFSATASGSDVQYQWYKNGVAIPSANFNLLALHNVSTADAGNYRARVQNDCGYADAPITRLQVKGPITIHRPALFPDCSLTCLGSDVSIFPPNPLDLSLNIHLQKNVGSAEFPNWADVRVSTPSAPTNFVFQNVDRSFAGKYRFYIDGSPCDGYADSEHSIQIGFDITQQPVSLSNVRPCSNPTFNVASAGSCATPYYYWVKDYLIIDDHDPHYSGVHTDTLTILGARYEDEGSYGCRLVDTNQCNYICYSELATLRLVPSQWVLRSTSGPSARYGHAMVYDTARGVTMLFGGEKLSDDHSRYENFGDVWEWNGANWRQRTTFSATSGWVLQTNTGYWYPAYNVPVPRDQPAMSYDSKRGRVVLFGGRSIPPNSAEAFVSLADTWEWDGLAWQLRATNGPAARYGHSMAYDAARGVTVLFGGISPDFALVWEWDGISWTSNTPSSGPPSQDIGSMAYDAWRHKIVYGPTWDGFTGYFFWTWNGSAWNSQGTGFGDGVRSPPYGAMVFDSYRVRPLYFGGELSRFGGSTAASFFESGSAALRAQWSLQPDMASTSLFVTNDFIDPAIVIQIRQRTDPLSDFLWNQLSDATRQTLTNGSSTIDDQLSALSSDFNRIISGGPFYDPQRFAGVTLSAETLAFQRLNPWWAPDPSLIRFNRLLLEDYYPTAIARSPSTPPGRLRHAMAYDSRRHATVVFGGLYDPDAPPQMVGNETWELLAFDKPIIIEPPASQYRKPGENIAFNVSARAPAGALARYQWYLGQQVLSDNTHVQGSNKDTLSLLNITPADAGQYWVRVSDDCGFTDSFPAILTLDPTLQVFSIANALKLIWSDPNVVLEQADAVSGPWTPVPGATPPFDIALAGPGKFFRLRPTAL